MARGSPRYHLSQEEVLEQIYFIYARLLKNLKSGELSGTSNEILASAMVEAYALGLDHGTDHDVDNPREVVDFLFNQFEPQFLKRRGQEKEEKPKKLELPGNGKAV
jgi:hypothetical protein